jgi:uncharacterized oxidoreductase
LIDLKVEGHTLLITGGATGIGFALAEAFVQAGSEVIICGRRRTKLQEAKAKIPSARIRKCDVSLESERKKLLHWSTSSFPSLDILVNNAGIQRQVDFTSPKIIKRIPPVDDELAINLESTIRLCALFAPKFLVKKSAAIVNISSGLAFVPIAEMPIYCATKAAIHSFTTSLRHQLKDTSVRVFEAIPPTTDTDLDASFAGEEEQAYRGISPQEVAAAIIVGLKEDKQEIVIGQAQRLQKGAMQNPEQIFNQLNG